MPSRTSSTNARITPGMSFSGSHRDTWTTSGASTDGAGPVPMTSANRVTRPGDPSGRVNATP